MRCVIVREFREFQSRYVKTMAELVEFAASAGENAERAALVDLALKRIVNGGHGIADFGPTGRLEDDRAQAVSTRTRFVRERHATIIERGLLPGHASRGRIGGGSIAVVVGLAHLCGHEPDNGGTEDRQQFVKQPAAERLLFLSALAGLRFGLRLDSAFQGGQTLQGGLMFRGNGNTCPDETGNGSDPQGRPRVFARPFGGIGASSQVRLQLGQRKRDRGPGIVSLLSQEFLRISCGGLLLDGAGGPARVRRGPAG